MLPVYGLLCCQYAFATEFMETFNGVHHNEVFNILSIHLMQINARQLATFD